MFDFRQYFSALGFSLGPLTRVHTNEVVGVEAYTSDNSLYSKAVSALRRKKGVHIEKYGNICFLSIDGDETEYLISIQD